MLFAVFPPRNKIFVGRCNPLFRIVVVIVQQLLVVIWNDSSFGRWRDGSSSTRNIVSHYSVVAAAASFIPRGPPKCKLQRQQYHFKNSSYRSMLTVGGGGDQLQQQQQQRPKEEKEEEARTIVDRSTLVLLEHINLNVPTQDLILPFYFHVLGCGMDPRKVENLKPESTKKTLWANAGATQFHLPYDDVAQCIPGQIGLRYDSLAGLEQRLQQHPNAYKSSEVLENGTCFRLVDHYDNVFYCRAAGTSKVSLDWKQPIISRHIADDDTDMPEWKQEAVALYGRDDSTDCRGIDYIEFKCPMGTAKKIALFYNSVFDATTFCMEATDGDHDNDDDYAKKKMVAIVAIGKVDAQGRADQTLLFRETNEAILPYDGHHIALYVGTSDADFEQAFRNAQLANIVWVNPRFADAAQTVQDAVQKWKQFRFKNIIDMYTGATILELEHEMRSTQHEAWPGPRPMIADY